MTGHLMKITYLATLMIFLTPVSLFAQDSVRLVETFQVGYQYRVKCRVEIAGTMQTGGQEPLKVNGRSTIDYDERILVEKRGVERTIRQYAKMSFERKVGEQVQEAGLRPEVFRIVLLRHNNLEVPFAPAGPLTFNEIDMIRTDVFTPALQGMLPVAAVTLGQTWDADMASIKELTDLEKIDEGKITCKLEKIDRLVNRRQAKVTFRGAVKGLDENGPGGHELNGYLYFDLESNHLAYIHFTGIHALYDPKGKEKGRTTGTFVLTRMPIQNAHNLTDGDLRGLTLEPNDENTQLLFSDADLGVRFQYSRRWRVAGVHGKQIALDENRPGGSGLLITLESLTKLPLGQQYHEEAKTWLTQNKATVHRMDQPKTLQGTTLENFGVDAEVAKQRVWLDYYVSRQQHGGATMVARLLPQDFLALRADVVRIARSLQITKPQ